MKEIILCMSPIRKCLRRSVQLPALMCAKSPVQTTSGPSASSPVARVALDPVRTARAQAASCSHFILRSASRYRLLVPIDQRCMVRQSHMALSRPARSSASSTRHSADRPRQPRKCGRPCRCWLSRGGFPAWTDGELRASASEHCQPARAATARLTFSENSSRLFIGNHTPDFAWVDICAKFKTYEAARVGEGDVPKEGHFLPRLRPVAASLIRAGLKLPLFWMEKCLLILC